MWLTDCRAIDAKDAVSAVAPQSARSAIKMEHENCQVSRGDSAYASGLGKVDRSDLVQTLAGLGAELADRGVVEDSLEYAASPNVADVQVRYLPGPDSPRT